MEGSGGENLIGLAIQLGVIGVLSAIAIWQIAKRTRALREPLRDDECVSCGSRELTWPAPGVYACKACGYEGGSGVGTQHAVRQQAALNAMSSDERRRTALADLDEARTLLQSLLGSSAASWESGGGVGMAQADLLRAKQAMRSAAAKLEDRCLAVPPETVNVEEMAAGHLIGCVDGTLALGDRLAGSVAAGSLHGMKAEAQALLQRVDAALAHYRQVG